MDSNAGGKKVKVRCFSDQESAALYVATKIESFLDHTARAVLGLATGATPQLLYRQPRKFHRQGLSFSSVTTINLDEYVGLPSDHPQSYHRFMKENLFDYIDISQKNTFVPNGMAASLQDECRRYDKLLENHPIDLQILGIGGNGHIGFNEPDGSLMLRTHVASLAESTIRASARYFKNAAKVPSRAITVGLQSILQSRSLIVMAFGADKAKAVSVALSEKISTSVPASLIQTHSDVTFVLDDAAASGIFGRRSQDQI